MSNLTREQWLSERRNHIGASEVAAILGEDPRYEALHVWARKVHGEETPDADWLAFGRDMEAPIATLYAKRSERDVWDLGATEFQYHPDLPWLAATLDRQISASEKYPAPDTAHGHGALEIKNIESPGMKPHEWTADNPDILHYVIQNQIQLACVDYQWGSICGHFPYYQLPWFDQLRDDELLKLIYPALDEFWNHNVLKKIPPEPRTPKALAVVKHLWGTDNGETIALDHEALDLADKLDAAKANAKNAKAEIEEIESKLRFAMREASFGALPDGTMLTLKKTSVAGRTQIIEPYEFRTLRRSRPKARGK
jgi:putative phage-type endonuclease